LKRLRRPQYSAGTADMREEQVPDAVCLTEASTETSGSSRTATAMNALPEELRTPVRGGHESRRLHHRSHVPESRARAATGASQDGRSHGSTPTSWGVDAPPGELYSDHPASGRHRGTSRATMGPQRPIPQGSPPAIGAHTAAFLRRDGSSPDPSHGIGVHTTATSRRTMPIAPRRLGRNTPQGSSSATAEFGPTPQTLIRDRQHRPQAQRGGNDTQGSVSSTPTCAAQLQDVPAVRHDQIPFARANSGPPRTPRENQGAAGPTNHPCPCTETPTP